MRERERSGEELTERGVVIAGNGAQSTWEEQCSKQRSASCFATLCDLFGSRLSVVESFLWMLGSCLITWLRLPSYFGLRVLGLLFYLFYNCYEAFTSSFVVLWGCALFSFKLAVLLYVVWKRSVWELLVVLSYIVYTWLL